MDPDELIIEQVLGGQAEQFRVLVERYQGPVIGLVANLVHDRHAGTDIAQEVFLAAYRGLASFDPARSGFATWLFTIARNRAVNANRKRRPGRLGPGPDPADPRPTADRLATREFHDSLDRSLASLPAEQRTAFVMSEFHDLSYEAIARIEGVRVGTIRSRISRARARLRSMLAEWKDGVA
jgi:RNA polymerase sigma-70 factor (ECF subfamily)